MPKPIAPNPWRRGRRRTGGPGAQGNGVTQSGHSPATLTSPRASGGDGVADATGRLQSGDTTTGSGELANAGEVAKGRPQVIGLFADRASAELACRALAGRGYREDAIKLMISEETSNRHFADYNDRAMALAGAAIDCSPPGAVAAFSHRPRQCPATLNVAIYATPTEDATAMLTELLNGSGVPFPRIAEYETALRSGGILLSVITRSHDDARLIEIEWRRSYRAEKIHR